MGIKAYLIHSGAGCPEGRGALTPCVSWGWRGLKKMRPPQDNFWNSPKDGGLCMVLDSFSLGLHTTHRLLVLSSVYIIRINVYIHRGCSREN